MNYQVYQVLTNSNPSLSRRDRGLVRLPFAPTEFQQFTYLIRRERLGDQSSSFGEFFAKSETADSVPSNE
jgi:hypothetical protein